MLVETCEQLGKISGIILQIAVKGGDYGRIRASKTRPQRGALTPISSVTKAADAWVGLMLSHDLLPGAVSAGVINED